MIILKSVDQFQEDSCFSDGRLSGRIIYWPGGGKATTTVPELEPTFFLPLLFRQTLGRRCFSPLAARCCRCHLLLSFRPRPPTFPLLRSFWWWLAMVVGPAQLSFLFSNLSFYYYYHHHTAVSFFRDFFFYCPCC